MNKYPFGSWQIAWQCVVTAWAVLSIVFILNQRNEIRQLEYKVKHLKYVMDWHDERAMKAK